MVYYINCFLVVKTSLHSWDEFHIVCNSFYKLVLFLFLFFKNLFLFLAVLGLRCCARAFSSCSKRGLLFVAVRRLLTAVASLVAEL